MTLRTTYVAIPYAVLSKLNHMYRKGSISLRPT